MPEMQRAEARKGRLKRPPRKKLAGSQLEMEEDVPGPAEFRQLVPDCSRRARLAEFPVDPPRRFGEQSWI